MADYRSWTPEQLDALEAFNRDGENPEVRADAQRALGMQAAPAPKTGQAWVPKTLPFDGLLPTIRGYEHVAEHRSAGKPITATMADSLVRLVNYERRADDMIRTLYLDADPDDVAKHIVGVTKPMYSDRAAALAWWKARVEQIQRDARPSRESRRKRYLARAKSHRSESKARPREVITVAGPTHETPGVIVRSSIRGGVSVR